MVAVIYVIGIRKSSARFAGSRAKDGSETVRVLHRARPQKKGVKGSEHGGVHGDAECECDDGHDGKAGIFAQHAQAVAQILEKRFECRQPAAVAVDFFGLLEAAEF